MSRKVRRESTFFCSDGMHAVVSLAGEPAANSHARRATPCPECPWRADRPTGVFPPDAFRHSALTAYDMAQSTFACHMQGAERPATCAGFLLRGADHNLAVRLAIVRGRYDPRSVDDGGFPLYRSYRAMATANGVASDDPALSLCRGEDEDFAALRVPAGRG